MEMGFDRNGQLAGAASGDAGSQYDWQGLHARLAAAYALRRAPEREETEQDAVSGGSFDHRSARVLAFYGKALGAGSGGVNPNVSGNGNPTYDNDASVAGAHAAGD